MSKIAVIGTGYVGLVSGTVLSDFGHQVLCVDVNEEKIEMLSQGKIPIYEMNLQELVQRGTAAGRLRFTTDTYAAVRESDVIFIAVGTPPSQDGSADLSAVLQVAGEIASAMDGYKVIVDKSTVPVGTARRVEELVKKTLLSRGVDIPFDVISNPEFLREGSAVHDFMHPDRVVVGARSQRAFDAMREVYRVLFLGNTPFMETGVETAELIKYASNAFLAVKISYINEIANLCEQVGADVHDVARAMGMDGRISPKFLHPGPGYGGSCFPKDTRAIARTGQETGTPMTVIEAAIAANEQQKLRAARRVDTLMGGVEGKTLAILGLTYKPNTDDMRDAPSLVILQELAQRGAHLRVYDPQGRKEGAWRLKALEDSLTFCEDEYDALRGCSAVLLLTEWNQFRNLDLERVRQTMTGRYFFDFRNVYDRARMEAEGFVYMGVGR